MLVLNFAMSFDFGCCSLAQEMSFVYRYLPYFRKQLIIHLLLVHLPFQSLFTETSLGDQLLVSSSSSSALRAPCPLCCVFLSSSLFIIQFFCFCFFVGRGASLFRGYAGLSLGWLWEYSMLLICSLVGLLDVPQAGLEPASGSV
jgi:hypothetical protein